ncbi:MAG: biotin/lipoyl-containing protein [Luteimonas sp.]
MTDGMLSARFDGEGRRYPVSISATALDVHDGARRLRLEPMAPYRFERADVGGSGHRVLSPMPGRIVLVKVKAGDAVVEGQEMLVMEAMKMELSLKAPRDGTVAEVRAAAGDVVDGDATLVTLET